MMKKPVHLWARILREINRRSAPWTVDQIKDNEIHVWPCGDDVTHVLDEQECFCGPSQELVSEAAHRDIWMYTHHALNKGISEE